MPRIHQGGGCVERTAQRSQCLNVDSAFVRRTQDATHSLIKHPGRHFKNRPLVSNAAAKHDSAAATSLSMNRYLTAIKRMPSIMHPTSSFMGFASLGCTTQSVPTAVSPIELPVRSLRCGQRSDRSELTRGNDRIPRRTARLLCGLPERCSRARVRFAAPANRRALVRSAPFRSDVVATGGSGGNAIGGSRTKNKGLPGIFLSGIVVAEKAVKRPCGRLRQSEFLTHRGPVSRVRSLICSGRVLLVHAPGAAVAREFRHMKPEITNRIGLPESRFQRSPLLLCNVRRTHLASQFLMKL
jgi:hypothetical protein